MYHHSHYMSHFGTRWSFAEILLLILLAVIIGALLGRSGK